MVATTSRKSEKVRKKLKKIQNLGKVRKIFGFFKKASSFTKPKTVLISFFNKIIS